MMARRLLVAVAMTAAAAAVHAETPGITLNAGIYLIHAEVVNTMPTRAQGLMYRKTLGANDGMLFVFDVVERQCMWMKNTYIPLSVAFIDEQGVIVSIADMTPHSEENHCAARPARYAIEMNRGWFAQRGLKAGTRVGGLDRAPPPQ